MDVNFCPEQAEASPYRPFIPYMDAILCVRENRKSLEMD